MRLKTKDFNTNYYRLWQSGLRLPNPSLPSTFTVQYKKSKWDYYSRICVEANNINDAIERACLQITYASPYRPEEVDVYGVFDSEENLLWVDEPFYKVIQKKFEFRGIDRRAFLQRFAVSSVAILYGLRVNAGTTNTGLAGTASGFTVGPGEQLYTTPGATSWTVPAGVTSVCVVCVGGTSDSFFDTTSVVRGGGANEIGGTYTGDGGGNGGTSGLVAFNNSGFRSGCGAGGAGGYSGAGGDGGDGRALAVSSHSRGGAGGGVGLFGAGSSGGGGSNGSGNFPGSAGSGGAGGGGGGGYGSIQGPIGSGGSGGGVSPGNYDGGAYGGGAGGLQSRVVSGGGGLGWKNTIAVTPGASIGIQVGAAGTTTNSGDHGGGAVRIIWGAGRSFPNNAT